METTTAHSAAIGSSSQRLLVNVANRLGEFARAMPDAVAIAESGDSRGRSKAQRVSNSRGNCPTGYQGLSFVDLEADSAAIAAGLAEMGVEPGMRIALLVRPGIDFVSLVFALLRLGAVQVLIDPGMGLRNVVRALGEVQPDGFISSATVHMARWFLGRKFSKARFNVSVGRAVWGTTSLEEIRRCGAEKSRQPIAQTVAETPAAIIFTSGSTGPAKGVLFRHGNFDRQVTEIRDFYDIRPGEIDVSCFPLFGLFNAAMGVTSVIPKMDVSRPGAVDPRNIVAAINDWKATQAFGSPAVWNVVGRYCRSQKIQLPSLRRVLSAGAPVAAHVLQTMTECIHPEGEMHTPYGATESLPVASTSSSVVLSETFKRTQQGAGVCVGKKFDGIDWRVVRIKDGAIRTIAETEELERGEIGELIVRGPVVTTEYVARPEANALAKIQDTDSFWHRIGDVGYLDEHDRFWFCGRMSQRVTVRNTAGLLTMFTIPCEAIFNRHPDVFRSALVGMGPLGDQQPAIVVEPLPGRIPRGKKQRDKMIAELRTLAQTADHTASIDQILIRKSLPVDVRHNVKINREQLAVWAAKKLHHRSSLPQASKS